MYVLCTRIMSKSFRSKKNIKGQIIKWVQKIAQRFSGIIGIMSWQSDKIKDVYFVTSFSNKVFELGFCIIDINMGRDPVYMSV